MPNRKIAPKINEVGNLLLPAPRHYQLDNGISVYGISLGTQDILKLEVVFHAGRPYEAKKLAARATSSLIKEGTNKISSEQIAEKIDFYGGTLNSPISLDYGNLTLYCLTKHFHQLIPLLAEMLSRPAFPEEELALFIKKNQQRLQVDLTKNDVIAYRKITEFIFNEAHPYGYNSYPETYSDLRRSDLMHHYTSNFTSQKCSIFISGKIDDKIIKLLNQTLGQVIPSGAHQPFKNDFTFPKAEKVKIEHPDSIQTAIRIGRYLFDRNHPDVHGINILNTVLGGYFGSRLMHNIREDKGYTYNISSSIDIMRFGGYFFIGTEVGNEVVKPTLSEIYKEIKILREEPIGSEELQMVRNYMLGSILTMIDGPFNVADVIKTLVLEVDSPNYFKEMIDSIKYITPAELQDLAQKYLTEENLWEVIVGI